MILIIEGLDRCGKSTLVSNLRKTFFTNPKLIVHHSSSPPKNGEDQNVWEVKHYSELAKTFHNLSSSQGYDIVCDRFHLGSVVYGMKYRGLDPHTIFEVDRKIISNGTEKNIALILLTDYPEEIIKRDDGESIESTSSEFEHTRFEFIKTFESSLIRNKLHINITDNGGFENTYSSVVNFIDEMRGENAKSC